MPRPRYIPPTFNRPRFVPATFAGSPPNSQAPTPANALEFAQTPSFRPPVFVGRKGELPVSEEFERDPTESWKQLPQSGRIRYAAHQLRTVRIRYRDLNGRVTTRTVEPYSYRVKRPKAPAARRTRAGRIIEARKAGGINWYFFAWDQAKNEIRGFLVRSILDIQVAEEHYEPRYNVEF